MNSIEPKSFVGKKEKMTPTIPYELIDSDEKLRFFCDKINLKAQESATDVDNWLAIDTEFIGEKRFETLLCLIQIACTEGYYLIDPFQISDWQPFVQIVESAAILKITHAGENDYKLLSQYWGIVPRQVFDTQIAAGFLGFGYPASYAKLVERELNERIEKGYAATDWEARPLKSSQLQYALSDVVHLYSLYDKLKKRLLKRKRLDWALAEMRKWETPQYYTRDPHREAVMNTMMHGLRQQKQLFLLRLYEWRRQEAQRLNHSKEMILASKHIAPILKSIDYGKQALLDSRIIPDKVVYQHWSVFQDMYKKEGTAEELTILERIPQPQKEDLVRDASMDLLHSIVKFKCLEYGVASTLVLNKSDLAYLQPGEEVFSDKNDWRRSFLGEALVNWLNERRILHVEVSDADVVIKMKTDIDA